MIIMICIDVTKISFSRRTDLQSYTLEPRGGVILTTTKLESEKAIEAELELEYRLDRKSPHFDDSHRTRN